jgi:hypothetical protein
MTDEFGYTIGSAPTISATFSAGGVLADPGSVTLSVTDPDGITTAPAPVHPSTGTYTHTLTLTKAGLWQYRFTGTSPAAGAKDGELFVHPYPVAYSYDPSNDQGALRLYIDDRDLSSVGASTPPEQRSAIFSDRELDVFLINNGGSAYLAAAEALTVIAGNRSLLVQSRRIGDTTVDYGNVRADLLRQAAAFRAMYDTATGVNAPADAIAEIAYNDFSARRIIENRFLRGGES